MFHYFLFDFDVFYNISNSKCATLYGSSTELTWLTTKNIHNKTDNRKPKSKLKLLIQYSTVDTSFFKIDLMKNGDDFNSFCQQSR